MQTFPKTCCGYPWEHVEGLRSMPETRCGKHLNTLQGSLETLCMDLWNTLRLPLGNFPRGCHNRLRRKTTKIYSEKAKNYIFRTLLKGFTGFPQISCGTSPWLGMWRRKKREEESVCTSHTICKSTPPSPPLPSVTTVEEGLLRVTEIYVFRSAKIISRARLVLTFYTQSEWNKKVVKLLRRSRATDSVTGVRIMSSHYFSYPSGTANGCSSRTALPPTCLTCGRSAVGELNRSSGLLNSFILQEHNFCTSLA